MKSVDDARVSLKKEWLYETPKRPIVALSDSELDDDVDQHTKSRWRIFVCRFSVMKGVVLVVIN